MIRKCPVNMKSEVKIQTWVCDHAHPVGCVEHNGLYYFNKVDGNVADPNIGVGNGSYDGGFNLCGLMTHMANMAIDEYHDEEFDAMLVSFFECLSTYDTDSEYMIGDVVINNGIIHESVVDDNSDDVSNTDSWITYGTACTILTAFKVNAAGEAVLGVDAEGNEVVAGDCIITCDDLNTAIQSVTDYVDSEIASVNETIVSEVNTLNETIVSEVNTLNQTIDTNAQTAADCCDANTQLITDTETNLQNQIDSNAQSAEACCELNSQAIANNTQNIQNNTTNIQTNTDNVFDLNTQVTTNTTNIESNTTQINTNTESITSNSTDITNLTTMVNANAECCTNVSNAITQLQTDVSNAGNTFDSSFTVSESGEVSINCEALIENCDLGGTTEPPACTSVEWAVGNAATVVEGSDGKFYKLKAAGSSANDPVGNSTDWLGPFDTCELATAAEEEVDNSACIDWAVGGSALVVRDPADDKFYQFRPEKRYDAGLQNRLDTQPTTQSGISNWAGPFDTCAEAEAFSNTCVSAATSVSGAGGANLLASNYTPTNPPAFGTYAEVPLTSLLGDYANFTVTGYFESDPSDIVTACSSAGGSSFIQFNKTISGNLIPNSAVNFERDSTRTGKLRVSKQVDADFVVTEVREVCICT